MQDISPAPVFQGVFAYQLTAALKAALELDLFSAIARGATTPEALAAATGASERGMRILADYLVVSGFIEKHGGEYGLTPSSAAFLDRASPTCLASVHEFLCSPEMIQLCLGDPAAAVREGGSPGLANLEAENPVWIKFARAMLPWAAPQAQHIAGIAASSPVPPRRVVDISASHGLYGILVAKAVPGAEIIAVDWANVLTVARENAAAMGVADRFRFLAGSAFDVDWGTDIDLVLLPNFLHHFDEETCVRLLHRIRASLSSTGRVLATEFVPNEDRVSPPESASFALTMLLTTPRGDAYTQSAYARMARDAGFAGASFAPLPPTPQTLVEFLR